MGIFFNRKKQQTQPVTVTFSVNNSLASGQPTDPERIYWSQEGMRIRREKVEALGVDTTLFTQSMAFQDAMRLIHEFAPTYTALGLTFSRDTVTVDFQNLTKTGKLPKNVCKASLSSNRSDIGNCNIYVRYLKDATINMADISFSANMKAFKFSVRIVNGDYRVTFIDASNWLTDVTDTLYLEKQPTSNNEQKNIIAKQIQWLSRREQRPGH